MVGDLVIQKTGLLWAATALYNVNKVKEEILTSCIVFILNLSVLKEHVALDRSSSSLKSVCKRFS